MQTWAKCPESAVGLVSVTLHQPHLSTCCLECETHPGRILENRHLTLGPNRHLCPHLPSPLPVIHTCGFQELITGRGGPSLCLFGRDLTPTSDSKNNFFLVCSGPGPPLLLGAPAHPETGHSLTQARSLLPRWAVQALRRPFLPELGLPSWMLLPLLQLKPGARQQSQFLIT